MEMDSVFRVDWFLSEKKTNARAARIQPSTESGSLFRCMLPGLLGLSHDFRIWIVVSENFAEVSAVFRHCSGSGLAKADPVALTNAIEQCLRALLPHGEIVAGNRVPSQGPSGFQA